MRLRHTTEAQCRDLCVTVTDADATIADLSEALDPHLPVTPLLVNGRVVPAATPLDRAGIADGSLVQSPSMRAGTAPPPPACSVIVTTGLDAGRRIDCPVGDHVLGRRGADAAVEPGITIADPTVSTHHCLLRVLADGTATVTDLGSRNGTWIDGDAAEADHRLTRGTVWRCGSATMELVDASTRAPEPPPVQGGTRPLHRRPRVLPPGGPAALTPPPPPDPPPSVTPVGVLSVVASVGFGAVMVVVLGSWAYALFALLGPVVMVANALDGRRRRGRTRRRTVRSRRRALSELETALGERQVHEIGHRAQRFIGPARAAQIAHGTVPGCWERRPDDPDAGCVRIAIGPDTWTPPVEGSPEEWAEDVRAIVDAHRPLAHVSIGLCLTPGAAVAVVGPVDQARSLVRSVLVQAATLHGPADLRVAALAAGAPEAWDWAAWLPHARSPEHGSLLAGNEMAADRVATTLCGERSMTTRPDERNDAPLTVVVLDDPAGLRARRSAAHRVLRTATSPDHGLVPVVIVEDHDDVPAACEIVLEIDAGGALRRPGALAQGPAVAVGTSLDIATDIARDLAALDDPEVLDAGRGLPDAVALADLLGAGRLDRGAVVARWSSAGEAPPPIATLGATDDGLLQVDLEADGPHVLVAGTTGAGKSELLRTLVTSLAVASDPDQISFVLIDFKGGSAFDACARLPHTVGVVTDLDAGLAARALRCLEAELRHRERRLRAAGADDLIGFRRAADPGDPLPRIVVVIDEFATLAAELPDFVDALVDIAQRGRSLGVHLVLATQRPSGSVSEHIKANTGLRIALRVESKEDSIDVIDGPAAASLPRRHPGRALVRFGAGDVVAAQTARVTGAALGDQTGSPATAPAIGIEPLGVDCPGADRNTRSGDAVDRTDLDRIAQVLRAAWEEIGGRPPRRPWPDPLPDELAWPLASDSDPAQRAEVRIGLADHPEQQRQAPWSWSAAEGALAVVGASGAGTTTTLATVALELARRQAPQQCHIHVIDLGNGDLDALAGLPHVGAVIGADDGERQRRLIGELSNELGRRRAADADSPGRRRVLLIDGLETFAERCDDAHGDPTWDRLCELVARGGALGIQVAFSANATSGPAHRLASTCRQRLVMTGNDPADYPASGIATGAVPTMVPGRAISPEGPTVIQVARAPGGLGAAVARIAGSAGARAPARGDGPGRVSVLPDDVELAALEASSELHRCQTDPALLVGVADAGLVAARLRLRPGGHALVAGPPRSGRTTLLATLASSALTQGLAVVIVGDPTESWPAAAEQFRADDPSLLDRIREDRPLLVLVDDADCTDDRHPVLADLVGDRRAQRHVVVAARNDRARAGYGHWLREVRADRCGIVLQPDLDLDGELVGARLPHVAPLRLGVGRGWMAGGDPEGWIQVARPPTTDATSVDPG